MNYLKTLLIIIVIFLSCVFKSNGQVKAKPADLFVDMIGVDVHFARSWTAYTNNDEFPNAEQTAVNVALSMRVRHLRDGIWGWSGGVEDFDMDGRGVVERFTDIHQRGVDANIPGGLNWIITDNTNDWKKLRDNYLIPLGERVIVLEGANENMGVSGDAQAYTQIRNWWTNILPTLPHLKIATNTGPTSACEIKDSGYIGDYVHYGNAHPYHFWPPVKPWGKVSHCNFNSTPAPPTISLWTAPDNTTQGTIGFLEATRAKRVRPDQPMIFTEWGYPTISDDDNNWGVDEATAAKYVLRGFLEHFNAGIIYSCHYELLDGDVGSTDPEGNFGLADFNGNLKQSGLALKRMIALLEDNGNTTISTNELNYTLSGGGGLSFVDDHNATTNEIHQTLLQKMDGTYYLILWQEPISTNSSGEGISISPVDVTINFNHNIAQLKAYLPAINENANPLLTSNNISTLSISVPDHPVVIEITDTDGMVSPFGISTDLSIASINETAPLQLTALIAPSNTTNQNITWSSDNTSVATVSSSGLVRGVGVGSATITVTTIDGNKTATMVVTVTEAFKVQHADVGLYIDGKLEESSWQTDNLISKPTSGDQNNESKFDLLWDANYLYVGIRVMDDELRSLPTNEPGNNDAIEIFIDGNQDKSGEYDNSDIQIIKSIDSTGVWTSRSATGIVDAIALIDGGYSMELAIPWLVVNKFAITGSGVGFDISIDDNDMGTDLSDGITTWFGDGNNHTSTINFDDMLLMEGSTSAIPVTGISLDSASLSVLVGTTKQLTAEVSPLNATNKNVVWSSSNSSVASVSQTGLVSALSAGELSVKAKTEEGDFEASCLVNSYVITGVEEAKESLVEVYPNPVNDGKVYISGVKGDVTVKISDVLGRIVYLQGARAKNGVIEINNLNFNAGLYFLSTNNQNKTFKLRWK